MPVARAKKSKKIEASDSRRAGKRLPTSRRSETLVSIARSRRSTRARSLTLTGNHPPGSGVSDPNAEVS